jgi:urea-proton symporter
MILGAAGVISALTGMNIVASTFLLPLGVIVYTVAGGLKAIFLTDYVYVIWLLLSTNINNTDSICIIVTR